MKKIAWIGLPALALAALALPNFADDKPEMPKMTPDEQKAMETCMKLGMPGEQHKSLATLAGNWNYICKFRMGADQPWSESKGTGKNETIYGGRFISQTCKGDMMGMPFEGQGLIGYDNAKKKYVSTWADNMGTQIMYSEGTSDNSIREITYHSKMYCPIRQKDIDVRMVIKLQGDDKYTMEWYEPDLKTNAETKTMEINYTKAKM